MMGAATAGHFGGSGSVQHAGPGRGVGKGVAFAFLRPCPLLLIAVSRTKEGQVSVVFQELRERSTNLQNRLQARHQSSGEIGDRDAALRQRGQEGIPAPAKRFLRHQQVLGQRWA